jgi:hypothetical protein
LIIGNNFILFIKFDSWDKFFLFDSFAFKPSENSYAGAISFLKEYCFFAMHILGI